MTSQFFKREKSAYAVFSPKNIYYLSDILEDDLEDIDLDGSDSVEFKNDVHEEPREDYLVDDFSYSKYMYIQILFNKIQFQVHELTAGKVDITFKEINCSYTKDSSPPEFISQHPPVSSIPATTDIPDSAESISLSSTQPL
ncbi:hypothetical protein WA158_003152 [Blastocystis sp. Blastoise]